VLFGVKDFQLASCQTPMELSIGTGNLIHLRQRSLAELQQGELQHEYQGERGEESIREPSVMLDGHRDNLHIYDADRRIWRFGESGFRWKR
jgi:hypothetical protein